MKMAKLNKKLYVGTVNGENGWHKKSAKTFIYSVSANNAAYGLFRRYMKLFGKADVTEIFEVDKENKKIKKVMFSKKW